MMFVILSYDVQEVRCAKIAKIAKKYLNYMQRSLYQGYLTEKQLKRLQEELFPRIDPENDSVIIYSLRSDSDVCIEKIGAVKERGSFIY